MELLQSYAKPPVCFAKEIMYQRNILQPSVKIHCMRIIDLFLCIRIYSKAILYFTSKKLINNFQPMKKINMNMAFFFQNGDTALHISAALKRRKIAKLVVDSGIDINIRNKVGFTKCYDSDSLNILWKSFGFMRSIWGAFSKIINIISASLTLLW